MEPAAFDGTDGTTDAPTDTTKDTPTDAAEQWTSTVVLGDGVTALLRPIVPGDAPTLAAFHQRQSSDSRYRRFFSPKPELSETELKRFTTVDFVDRVALVVEDHGEFIAWASYERLKNRADAEVAFMVDDEQHGKGIATLLLEHLAAIAQSNGIERFTAQTLGDNRGMLAVFAKAGWPVHRRFESGVIDVDFPLADTSDFIDSVERREHRADSRAVARLLLPASIAVIGASDVPDSVGYSAWHNATADPRCPVYPVNARHDTIGGKPAFRSVTAIPDEVGLAVIAVPSHALVETIDECIEKRVRGAVVITAPSEAEVDVAALVAHARRNGLRIIGPSSFGIASPRPETRLQATLVAVDLPSGEVAISMQSGTLATSLLLLAHRIGLGLSWFVSLGDKADVSANDLLQFWEDDDATRVIGVYTESLGNPRKFARIARRVSATKPIVAVRTGAAQVGTANAALYEQTGVIEVPTVTALLDTARVLAAQPLMDGNRVAVVSNAGSPRVLAAATLTAAGLEVAEAPPLDWRSTPADYSHALEIVLGDDSIHAVIVIHAPATFAAVNEQTSAIDLAARRATKPIVAVMLGANDGRLVDDSPVQNFAFPEQAAAVVGRVAAYSAWRRTEAIAHAEADDEHHIDPARAGTLIAEHLESGSMTPEALCEMLASYAVKMPETRLVDAADAVWGAHEVGFPVAVKATGRKLGRSVEAGIALDLTDEDDVVQAVRLMREHLGDAAARMHVQHMVPPGVDLRIKAELDDRLGPVITVGIGGVQADAIGDESSRLAPISPATARALVAATRAASLLGAASLELVADLVTRVAQLASDHATIAELDLNPVIVSDHACWVVDAKVQLRQTHRPDSAVRRLA
jgi:acyl-CoA synthetase (NDP forming)/GNAT superfamily N-acetyltransferase